MLKQKNEEQNMNAIEPLLNIKDIRQIFSISQVCVYRWVSEARKGRSRFPLPINGTDGGKRKLLWNRNDIEQFCQSKNAPQPLVNVITTKQVKKQAAAYQERQQRVDEVLARHGYKPTNK
jgi:predicted DNA-binding transcriptional regulator AlpA